MIIDEVEYQVDYLIIDIVTLQGDLLCLRTPSYAQNTQGKVADRSLSCTSQYPLMHTTIHKQRSSSTGSLYHIPRRHSHTPCCQLVLRKTNRSLYHIPRRHSHTPCCQLVLREKNGRSTIFQGTQPLSQNRIRKSPKVQQVRSVDCASTEHVQDHGVFTP
jgi:hypothetical protein